MAAGLLQTKLYRPMPRPDLVPRERLRERLRVGLWSGRSFTRKLTLVAAPAGFGKTTLIADFALSILDGQRHPEWAIPNLSVSWLSLDEDDNDLTRFVRYLFAALQHTVAEVKDAPHILLENSDYAGHEEALAELINAIAALPVPILLLIDDYHVLHTSDIERLMTFLLDHQPPNLHLVIAARADPALPLTRLRARGQLRELRAHDLRFTDTEATNFLTQTMGLNLQSEWITTLEQRTEGWIAGLQLAGLSLQGHTTPDAFIQAFSGSHRYVIDYLVDEVLRHQPPALRDFLTKTAILERLCGPLCDAVSGYDQVESKGDISVSPPLTSGQMLLEYLERTNLFLIPLDDERKWYRYHHLFADSLRAQLDAAQQRELHRRAAFWFQAHNFPIEAVHHARATDDLAFMTDIIERAVQQPAAWSSGQLSTLVQWLDALPDAVRNARPELSLHASRALFLAGRITESERLLDRATAAIQDRKDDDAIALLALADVYRGSIAALHGHIQRGIAQIQQGLARLPEPALHARARALDMLGLAYNLVGDVGRAEKHFLQASAVGQTAGVAFMAINAACEAAEMQALQGRLTEAQQTCHTALSLSDAPIPPQGLAWATLGEIARERNDLATAERYLQQGLALAQQGGLTDDVQVILSFLVWLRQNQGDPDSARRTMTQATRIVQAYQVACLTERLAAQQARLALAQGRVDTAARWADDFRTSNAATHTEIYREYEKLTLTRVELALGQTRSALDVLAPVLASARAAGRQRAVMEALLLKALALRQEDREREAVDTLGEAIALAAPERWLRLFIDAGVPLIPLLMQTRSQAPAFVDELLSLLRNLFEERPPSSDAARLPDTGESLSTREVEILGLLAEGMTNREIGEALFIGVGTVKWYLTNLYDKLDVGSRTQAVARAREFGLLP